MHDAYFLSYSDDGGRDRKTRDFALRLREALLNGSPSFNLWVFHVDNDLTRSWDFQAQDVIRQGKGLLFAINDKSVLETSACHSEWTEARKFDKPVVLLQWQAGVKTPMGLNHMPWVDFTGDFATGLHDLQDMLSRLESPAGQLETLRERRDEVTAELSGPMHPDRRTRLERERAALGGRIDEAQALLADPVGSAARNRERVERAVEDERRSRSMRASALPGGSRSPAGGSREVRVVNQTPGETPTHYQDRVPEARIVGGFLGNASKRLLVVWGRGGIGKTAVVCRVLNHLREHRRLPDSDVPLEVTGIVFLNARSMLGVAWPYFFADLCRLLPTKRAGELLALFKSDQRGVEAKALALANAFAAKRTVVLLDNFEDLVDPSSEELREPDFQEALQTLLRSPQHGIKLILTTQVLPRGLAAVEPGRQVLLPLDKGLETPFAEEILRAMDEEGLFGLKTAPDALLARARACTRGHPKALEALFGAVASNGNTSLEAMIETAEGVLRGSPVGPRDEQVLPESVMQALVGEAFWRLDGVTRQVMQALAVFNRAVSSVAVDYLLLPHVKTIRSADILARLVNWHFVRREGKHYGLHSIDRAYVFAQLHRGSPADREQADDPPFTQFALLHRAAGYFHAYRAPRTEWLKRDDLDYQVAEFELRCEGEEYDQAARVLLEIDRDYLSPWGLDREVVGLHERLQGHLVDPRLRHDSVSRLGKVYLLLSRYQDAMRCLEDALSMAGTLQDRLAEADALSALGLCHFRQGDFTRAIELQHRALCQIEQGRTDDEDRVWIEVNHVLGFAHSAVGQTPLAVQHTEAALETARRLGDRRQACYQQGFLGLYASYLGDADKALEFDHAALGQARDLKLPRDIVCHLGFLAEACCTQRGDFDAAIRHAEEALRIEAEIGSPLNGSWCNQWLAVARGLQGDLVGARRAADAACRFDEPLNNQNSTSVLGVIALRQGDAGAARRALEAAIGSADALIQRCDRNWEALDAKGLALSALALYDGPGRLQDAVSTFRAARRVTADRGTIRRALRQLDLLAPSDTAGLLAQARSAAGEPQP